jgi:ABC-type sugar transport system substrate-binding protein
LRVKYALRAGAAFAVAALLAAGCTSKKPGSVPSAGVSGNAGGLIGEAQLASDSPFWNTYVQDVPRIAKSWGVRIKQTTADDATALTANVGALLAGGAKALVLAPGDAAALQSVLSTVDAAKIPVVTIETEPSQGKVFMVVRVDERSYGETACKYVGGELRGLLGKRFKGVGDVVVLGGDPASPKTSVRTEAFGACMQANYQQLKIDEQTSTDPPTAIGQLDAALAHGKVSAIYLESSKYLAAVLSDLQAKGLLKPRGQDDHIVIVSTDGVAAELKAIKEGAIDATVSQPVDSYAGLGVFYAQQALLGKTFAEGKTDHGSTIVKLPDGNLEDQLRAPLVTLDGGGWAHGLRVDDPSVWGNQTG